MKILYSTEYREIENIEVDAEGASVVVTAVDPINCAPAPCVPSAVPPRVY